MPRTWTEEQKAAQREKIKAWKPWEKSTGPKTLKGKERCKMNAWRSGAYTADFQILREGLRQHAAFMMRSLAWLAAQTRREELRKKLRERSINQTQIKQGDRHL